MGKGVSELRVDRDACKGSADTPREATLRTTETPEPPSFSEESMSDLSCLCSLSCFDYAVLLCKHVFHST